MSQKLLGKSFKEYANGNSGSLDRIPRIISKKSFGHDYWNAYEFSYLDKTSSPTLKVLEILIPSNSTYTVESKSLKIYLNSFYKKKFSNESDVLIRIKKDLDKLTQSKIKIKFVNNFQEATECIVLNSCKLLRTKANKPICFRGFRSVCPVTSQPDYANIYIFTDALMDVKWLKKYLASFKERGEFHEQCIQDIFETISIKYSSNSLEVAGRFMRRGGIDINPIRSNKKRIQFKNFRFFNQ